MFALKDIHSKMLIGLALIESIFPQLLRCLQNLYLDRISSSRTNSLMPKTASHFPVFECMSFEKISLIQLIVSIRPILLHKNHLQMFIEFQIASQQAKHIADEKQLVSVT